MLSPGGEGVYDLSHTENKNPRRGGGLIQGFWLVPPRRFELLYQA